jgi:hypothetical protein
VHAPVFVAQFPLGLGHRRLERVSARADRHVVQRLGKGGPVGVLHLSAGELIKRLTRDLAEAVGVDLVERDADDPAAGDEPGARQVEQAGQQLAPRQVAGGTDQDNNLRMLGTDPRRNLCHACASPRRAELSTSLAQIHSGSATPTCKIFRPVEPRFWAGRRSMLSSAGLTRAVIVLS